MTTDANGLELSNISNSGYRHVTVLFDDPEFSGMFIAFADVPVDLQADCREYKAKNGDSAFGYQNVVTLGVFADVRDAAYVGQTFYGLSVDDRNANLVELFSGNRSVIPANIPTWNHPANAATMAAAVKRKATRTVSRKMGGRVPTGSLASVKAKLAKMFPNATTTEIGRAAVLCIKETGGATYISELGLA